MPSLFERLNRECFDGDLSAEVMRALGDRDDDGDETCVVIERFLRGMRDTRFPSRDFTPRLASFVGSMIPNIIPTAWGGMVPPITVRDRHVRIDDYLADNPWREPGPATMLDIGCGFPPTTAIDSAVRLPGWEVIGVDPLFDTQLVYDADGSYALMTEAGEVRYFQPDSVGDFERWNEMLLSSDAVRERFGALHATLRAAVDPADPHQTIEREDARLILNPLRAYERPNLRFMQGGIGDVELDEQVEVGRCLNVLYYFDDDLRRRADAWVHTILAPGGLFLCGGDGLRTTEARYSVFRKEGDRLAWREFAFTLDNIRPVCSLLPWYTMHDGERETRMLGKCVSLLRRDAAFIGDFDQAMDGLLEREQLCERDRHGYLVDLPIDAEAYVERLERVVCELDALGFTERAASILRGAGLVAGRNRVGHVSITPGDDDR